MRTQPTGVPTARGGSRRSPGRRGATRAVVSVVLVGACLAGSAVATAAPGDIVIGDRNTDGSPTFLGAMFRLPPAGGTPVRFTAIGAPLNPEGVAIEPSGWIDETQFEAVNRINPITGAVTPLATGAPLSEPAAVAVEQDGNLLVADGGPTTGGAADGKVIRVNAITGAQTVLASGGMLVDPAGIAIGSNGYAYVTDRNGGSPGYVLRINPTTGAQTVVASAGGFGDPTGIAFTPDGRLVVADETYAGQFRGALVRINVTTGAVTPVSLAASTVDLPTDVTVDSTGQVILSDRRSGGIYKVNLTSGAATELSTSPLSPEGVAIEPATTPACVVTATRPPGPSTTAQQDVTVTDFSGLASITNVAVTNGTVHVGGASGTRIDPGGTSLPTHPTSIVLTAVKVSAAAKTVWSFDVTNAAGKTEHCA
jgi:hypothetical protein